MESASASACLWWADCRKTPALFNLPVRCVTCASTACEVQRWLANRNYSNAVCADFAGATGRELLALTVADLAELLRVDFKDAVAVHALLHPRARSHGSEL